MTDQTDEAQADQPPPLDTRTQKLLLQWEAAEQDGKHVLTALWQLMKMVHNVPKTGEYRAGTTRYNFRGIEATIQEVGEAAREVGLMLQSAVTDRQYTQYEVERERGGKTVWNRCMVTVQYVFTSLVDGSSVQFEALGEGLDNSDKASNKAMSGALKYALGQALLLGTDDADPDSERPTAERPAPQQRQVPAAPRPQAAAPQHDEKQDPATRARKALAAAQAPGMTIEKLVAITNYANQEGVLDEPIAGVPLKHKLEAILAQHQQAPVEPMEPS